MTFYRFDHSVNDLLKRLRTATEDQRRSYLSIFERKAEGIIRQIGSDIKDDISTPWRKGRDLANLYRRKGDLLKALEISIRGPSTGSQHEVSGSVSFGDSEYAHIHELGTRGAGGDLPDLRAKGDFLWIPDESILDDRGVPTIRPGEDPSGFAFVRKITYGPDAGEVKGRREGSREWETLWRLRKTVAIPPRPFLEPAVEAQRDNLAIALQESVRIAFSG